MDVVLGKTRAGVDPTTIAVTPSPVALVVQVLPASAGGSSDDCGNHSGRVDVTVSRPAYPQALQALHPEGPVASATRSRAG